MDHLRTFATDPRVRSRGWLRRWGRLGAALGRAWTPLAGSDPSFQSTCPLAGASHTNCRDSAWRPSAPSATKQVAHRRPLGNGRMRDDPMKTRPASLHDPHQRRRGRKALACADPRLGGWIRAHGDVDPGARRPAYALLVSSIVGQQLSTKAAATIRARLLEAAGGRFEPRALLGLDDARLRACGISQQKARYLRDLSEHVLDGRLRPEQLWRHDDEEVVGRLTEVKGLGRWTAQMFLIFGLGRPDVLSTGDLGLLNAAQLLIGSPVPAADFEAMGEAWRPWRSLASLHLWHELDSRREAANP